jgi:hypothetical protein
LATKSAGRSVGGGEHGIAALPGQGSFNKMIIVVSAPPHARSKRASVANVIGDLNNANSTNTTSPTEMIAVRLNLNDMRAQSFSSSECLLNPLGHALTTVIPPSQHCERGKDGESQENGPARS